VDLHLYLRVLWRFRVVVLSGLLVATALALFSHVRISGDGFSYREREQWASYSTLLVTGPEFSLANSTGSEKDSEVAIQRLGAQQAALQRYTALAIIYSKLADSDQVLRIVRRSGPVNGKIEAAAVPASDNNSEALPLIQIAAISDSPERARSLARREVAALQEYLHAQYDSGGVLSTGRIVMSVVKQPTPPILLAGRSLTLPIVVFITVLIAVVALAFVLENLRPRVHSVRDDYARADGMARGERRSA
jgi:hypothetical protein